MPLFCKVHHSYWGEGNYDARAKFRKFQWIVKTHYICSKTCVQLFDAKYKIKLNAECCTTLHFGTAVYEQVVSLLLRFTVSSISCSPTGIPFSLYYFSPSYKHKMERQNKYIS